MKLNEICSKINGTELYRDGFFETLGLSSANNGMSTLTFIESEKYINKLSGDISCVLTIKDVADKFNSSIGVLICENPRISFFELQNSMAENLKYKRKSYKSKIGNNCTISKLASISDNNVTIGENVVIEEFVIIRENTVIGNNSIIRAGAIIGGEGFECKRKNNTIFCVRHLGGVIIGESVEIQYNTCIDKAVYPWDNTIVGNYCKIDNLVHLGHACKIGKETMLAANSLVGGRTQIGERCWIGVSCTISNGLVIGDGCKMNIGSVITTDLPDYGNVTGNFAIEHSKFIEFIKSIR